MCTHVRIAMQVKQIARDKGWYYTTKERTIHAYNTCVDDGWICKDGVLRVPYPDHVCRRLSICILSGQVAAIPNSFFKNEQLQVPWSKEEEANVYHFYQVMPLTFTETQYKSFAKTVKDDIKKTHQKRSIDFMVHRLDTGEDAPQNQGVGQRWSLLNTNQLEAIREETDKYHHKHGEGFQNEQASHHCCTVHNLLQALKRLPLCQVLGWIKKCQQENPGEPPAASTPLQMESLQAEQAIIEDLLRRVVGMESFKQQVLDRHCVWDVSVCVGSVIRKCLPSC